MRALASFEMLKHLCRNGTCFRSSVSLAIVIVDTDANDGGDDVNAASCCCCCCKGCDVVGFVDLVKSAR